MRLTFVDIAKEAGVSTATVDRVLNDRPGVRSRTREVVTSAAVKLGYIDKKNTPTPSNEVVGLDFVLPAGSNSFMHMLGNEIKAQSYQRDDVRTRVHLVEGFDPNSLAETLAQLEGKSDGVAVVAIDHPTVRNAIRRLAHSGTKILTLASDIQHVPCVGYVGIDNRSAGRLCGYLMSRFLGAGTHKIALLAGSASYRGHEEREMGFRHIISEHADQLEVIGFSEIRDDDERAFDAAMKHLKRHADLSAIYNIGAGNRGIARALLDTGRAQEVVFVGHDLTEHTKQFLLTGVMDAVIDQNARVEARDAIEQLSRAVRGQPWNAHPLRIQIICKENIPED